MNILTLTILMFFFCGVSYGQKNIVSLAPNITENLFYLDLVEEYSLYTTKQCDYPAEAKKTNRVGDFGSPNIEQILSLKPVVVFATEGIPRGTVDLLRKKSINVVELNPKSVSELSSSLSLLAETLKKDRSSKIAEFDQQLSRLLKLKEQGKHGKTRNSVVILQDNPLYVAGKNTWIDDVLRQSGWNNGADKFNQPYPILSKEFVLSSARMTLFTLFDADDEFKEKYKKHSIIKLNPDTISRPTVRVLESLKYLIEIE